MTKNHWRQHADAAVSDTVAATLAADEKDAISDLKTARANLDLAIAALEPRCIANEFTQVEG